MSRGTEAIFDLGALHHNLKTIRRAAPDQRIMAVVKANAYGHGLEPVVRALAQVDGFAVATLDEARRVREVSPHQQILLLEGITAAAELGAVHELKLDLVVHAPWQIELMHGMPSDQAIRVWLKVDTGMHRLGFASEDASAALAALRQAPGVADDIVLMSHLANADDREDHKTARQIERFEQLQLDLGLPVASLANSAGTLGWPQSRFDWVRVGLGLYGASPLIGATAQSLDLRPCMTLRSTVIGINPCRSGDTIGYGSVYRCDQDTRVGVVAIGYGDGYPGRAPSGSPVLLHGRHCPLVGRVSMDMLTIDLNAFPQAAVGDEVILWGPGLPVESVANCVDTIAYELLCGITARVPSRYRSI